MRQDCEVPDRELEASWRRTAARLTSAIAALPDVGGDGVADAAEYIDRNELGLAFDTVVDVADRQKAAPEVWRELRSAAIEMTLTVDDSIHGGSVQIVEQWSERPVRYPCPSCGFLVFDEEPGSYATCPVCGWEDDLSQLRFVTRGGASAPLIDYQLSHRRSIDAVSFDRDLAWRLLDRTIDSIEEPVPGVDYGRTYADDRTVYYYWRASRPTPGSDP